MLYKNNTNVGNTPSQRGLFATIQAMINSAIGSIPSIIPAALSKTDDTNVTLTLGGTPKLNKRDDSKKSRGQG